MTLSVKLLAGLAIAGLMATGAYAADLTVPDQPQPMLPSAPGITPFITIAIGPGIDSIGPFGVGVLAVGVDAAIADPIIIGGEAQLGVDFDAGGPFDIELFALGRVGAKVSDQVSIFAKGGLGIDNGGLESAFGGEVDFAAADNIDIVGEGLAMGPIFGVPNHVRGTIGVRFHM
jgi:hypothetical protein